MYPGIWINLAIKPDTACHSSVFCRLCMWPFGWLWFSNADRQLRSSRRGVRYATRRLESLLGTPHAHGSECTLMWKVMIDLIINDHSSLVQILCFSQSIPILELWPFHLLIFVYIIIFLPTETLLLLFGFKFFLESYS